MTEWTSIYSSHVDSIAYENGDLLVKWDSGKVSRYKAVPQEVAETVMKSWSVGGALAEMIKGQYEHSYTAASE